MHTMDMDIGEGKEGLLKLSQQQQLIQRLILIFCIWIRWILRIPLCTLWIWILGKEKKGLLKLSQQQQLIQRLILIFCIEDTMDIMDIPTDTMDTDTGEEKGDQ